MSNDIDMQSYAGATAQAAVEQQPTNSYQDEAQHEEYPVKSELIDQPVAEEQRSVEPSKQELNFEALRSEIDRMKADRDAEKREHALQLELLRVNSQQQQAQKEEPAMFEGMSDSDLPSVGDFRKEWDKREQTYKARLDELEFASTHSDYAEVLDKYLKPLVNENPLLAQGIGKHPTPAAYAYQLAKLYQQAKSSQTQTTTSRDAQRMVENSRKPGTLSQAGGQGALSKADYYGSMSDEQFYKLASKNLGEI